MLKQGQ